MGEQTEDDRVRWSGRTAVVTGAGSGIGRAVAVDLAARGADVLVVGRRPDRLATTVDTAGRTRGQLHAHPADLTDPDAAGGVVEAAEAIAGRLDVVVNNAGMGVPGAVDEISVDAFRRMWDTNVGAALWLTQAALPHLARSAGSVVNVSSTFGSRPGPGISAYGATKAALEQLTRSWALELAPRRIRVNAVAPGPTESEGLTAMGLSPEEIEHLTEAERQAIPLARRGVPDQVAPWIIALADPAAWATGVVLPIDGGYHLG